MRPEKFRTHYVTGSGTMMLMAETYIVLVRMSDGMCQRFSYEELGF